MIKATLLLCGENAQLLYWGGGRWPLHEVEDALTVAVVGSRGRETLPNALGSRDKGADADGHLPR